MGLHPPRVRYLKPYRYEVREGDDVTSIAGTFGMPSKRWPELIGANPHKVIVSYPGLRHQCFRTLGVGEPLNIPACWREPRDENGAVGAPPGSVGVVVDTLLEFQNAVRAACAALGIPNNLMDRVDDLAAVVYSWWPFLKDKVSTIPSTPPMAHPDLVAVITNMGLPTWTKLLESANVFLTQYGIPSGELPSVQAIPWGDIPWVQLQDMWTQIPPSTWTGITSVLANLPPMPGMSPAKHMLPPSGIPNFFDPTTWSQPMYKSTPFANTTWSDTLAQVLRDPRFASCASDKPENLTKLKQCPQCYTNASEFLDRLCASGDPCDCDEPSGGEEPTKPPVHKKDDKSNFMTYALLGTGILGLIALGSVIASEK